MTQEQKAKAYDEVIEKLRNFYRDYDTVSCLIDVKEELANRFPELKESEDEIVRKWIIDYLNNRILNSSILDEKENCKKALAWLEKQGKQKPADKSDSIINILNNENRKVQQEDLIKKPSLINLEENEMILSEVISILDSGFMPSSMERAKLVKGLQSIKLHPQQDWSKEDEKIYQSIMDDTVQENQLDDKQTNWLENIKYRFSTRPQNTWKPSKEQLHYLYWIANVRLGDSVVEQEVSKHLNELYNDLKKLKG